MGCTPVSDQKNFCWIWIAVDGYGKRFIDFAVGDRSSQTAKKFWNEIKHHEMGIIASDYWKPYESIIPKEKHVQTKAETFTVEGV
jgi:insertion element IS1 protein InsB